MYVYYDVNGVLKEIVNDEALRQGNEEINAIWVYTENRSVFTGVTAEYRLYDGRLVEQLSGISNEKVYKEIPFDARRDLKFFHYNQLYGFYQIKVPDEVLTSGGNNPRYADTQVQGADVLATITLYINQQQIVQGLLTFWVEGSVTGSIVPDERISLSQWYDLRSLFGMQNMKAVTNVDNPSQYAENMVLFNTTNRKFYKIIQSQAVELPLYYIGLTGNEDVHGVKDFKDGIKIAGSDAISQATGDARYARLNYNNIFLGENNYTITPTINNVTIATTEDVLTHHDSTKQDKLVAGRNITIENGNMINAIAATYEAGYGIYITRGYINVDTNEIQEKLTAGSNIVISDENVISAVIPEIYEAGAGIEIDEENKLNVLVDDSSIVINDDNKLEVDTTVIQPKLTAGEHITINNNVISAEAGVFWAVYGETLYQTLADNFANNVATKLKYDGRVYNMISAGRFVSVAEATTDYLYSVICTNLNHWSSKGEVIPTRNGAGVVISDDGTVNVKKGSGLTFDTTTAPYTLIVDTSVVATQNDLNNYLPKSGGDMSGDIAFKGAKPGIIAFTQEGIANSGTLDVGAVNDVQVLSATGAVYLNPTTGAYIGDRENPTGRKEIATKESVVADVKVGVTSILNNDRILSVNTSMADESNLPATTTAIRSFVNSSISTATATFRGTVESLEALQALTGDLNDYAFYKHVDTHGNTVFDRYKYTDGNPHWVYEYTLNNSSFTQAQWNAISSGIDATKVSSYDTHIADTSNPHSVTKAQVGLGNVDNTADVNKPISTATQTALDNKLDKNGFNTAKTGNNSYLQVGNKDVLDVESSSSVFNINVGSDDTNVITLTSENRPQYSADGLTNTNIALVSDIHAYTSGDGININNYEVSVDNNVVMKNRTNEITGQTQFINANGLLVKNDASDLTPTNYKNGTILVGDGVHSQQVTLTLPATENGTLATQNYVTTRGYITQSVLNGYFKADGSVAMTGDFNANGHDVENVNQLTGDGDLAVVSAQGNVVISALNGAYIDNAVEENRIATIGDTISDITSEQIYLTETD